MIIFLIIYLLFNIFTQPPFFLILLFFTFLTFFLNFINSVMDSNSIIFDLQESVNIIKIIITYYRILDLKSLQQKIADNLKF